MIKQWIHKQQLLEGLLLGLPLFALVFLTPETANAAAATENLQEVQLETVSMFNAHSGWALEKDRTRVFHTNDGLLHWKNVTPTSLHLPVNDGLNTITTYCFLDAGHAYLGVLQNGATSLFWTQDSGKTWTTVPFNISQYGISQITFLDAQHGWMTFDIDHGHGNYYIALMSTSDGGKTWQTVFQMTPGAQSSLPEQGLKTFTFTSPHKGWVTGTEDFNAPNARLYETLDGGETWTRVNLPELPHGIYSFSYGPYFTNAQDGTVLVQYGFNQGAGTGYYLLTYRTHDGGKTRVAAGPALQSTVPNEWEVQSFHNAEQGWTLGIDSDSKPVLHQTTDGGHSWKTIYPVGLQPFTEIVLELNFFLKMQGIIIDKANDGTQTLFLTDNAGHHWHALHPVVS